MKIALLTLFLLSSCGDSPLLNHTKLGDTPSRQIGLQTALQFSKIQTGLSVVWRSGCPNLFDDCIFDLNLEKALPADSKITAELWMPAMGHGSSPITSTELGPLSWQMTEVYFIMPGHWQVKLHLQLADGQTDEAILDYRL